MLKTTGIEIEGTDEPVTFHDFDEACIFVEDVYGYEGLSWNFVKESNKWESLHEFLKEDGPWSELIEEENEVKHLLFNAQVAVMKFQTAFGHPVGTEPKMLEPERLATRQTWLQEEVNEISEAKTVEDLADGIADVIYIALGHAVEAGIDIDKIFKIVQDANMAKLGPDGKPVYKDDNKIGKPEGWEAPEPKIVAELERQTKMARGE